MSGAVCRDTALVGGQIRVVVPRCDQRRHLATGLRIEAVAREQRVGTLASFPRIVDPVEGPAVPRDQPFRGQPVRRRRRLVRVQVLRPQLPTLGEDLIDQRAIDALEPKLVAERALAARVCPITRLDPGSSEGVIVQHAQVAEPRDGRFDERSLVAGAREPATDFRYGS
jgi:hypothetical protein